ncbi:MAG: ring-1,2-phenylacetyl-CoA epoxidase subunit PaaC [Limisphaerales bacterium]|jgi:ring-1,2-phenylacetyl-CoA epoxidase subunit PaaC
MENWRYQYLLFLGDNSMMLGHRLSELCSHGPNLETDIAITNISLDLFGQVRSYFQYAALLSTEKTDEDQLAFGRTPNQYLNTVLTEQPNADFGYVIARQFLFDAWHLPYLEALMESKDPKIAAVAAKSVKECRYHIRFSSGWMNRLGDGTEESHNRLQAGFDSMFPYCSELFIETEFEKRARAENVSPDLGTIKVQFEERLNEVIASSGLKIPTFNPFILNGKTGMHSENLDHILKDLQFMLKEYPQHQW